LGEAASRTLHKTDLPQNIFPSNRSFFINDLESTCYGILALNVSGKLSSLFSPLWPQEAPVQLKPLPYLVLAMGTGLGVALILVTKSHKKFEVLPLEFGHVQINSYGFSNPQAEEERRMIQYISDKLYKKKFSLETEDICSGRGLGYTYEWIVSENPQATPNLSVAQIAQRAAEDDPYASKALLIHYKWLFRCAQSLSVGFQTNGVFLAGDNQVANSSFVKKHLSSFKEEYLLHPKQEWIDNVPIFTQMSSFNINILGALYYAQHM